MGQVFLEDHIIRLCIRLRYRHCGLHEGLMNPMMAIAAAAAALPQSVSANPSSLSCLAVDSFLWPGIHPHIPTRLAASEIMETRLGCVFRHSTSIQVDLEDVAEETLAESVHTGDILFSPRILLCRNDCVSYIGLSSWLKCPQGSLTRLLKSSESRQKWLSGRPILCSVFACVAKHLHSSSFSPCFDAESCRTSNNFLAASGVQRCPLLALKYRSDIKSR